MKSTAHLKGHPLHPILVVFPIAFFIGAFIFELLGWFCTNESFTTTAYYLSIGGVIGGVAAAVPGLIDFIYTIPPDSSAKKRGVYHMTVNLSAVIIFTNTILMRDDPGQTGWGFIAAEGCAIALMTIGGWLGGTLVFRNQIGVDMRYAGAGKWKQEYITTEDKVVEVATASELKPNQMKLVVINNERIVIARAEKEYVAFSDHCTHKGGSLAGGSMMCGTVQCPWHGSQFDVKTGEVKAGPAKQKITVYKIFEEGNKIKLEI